MVICYYPLLPIITICYNDVIICDNNVIMKQPVAGDTLFHCQVDTLFHYYVIITYFYIISISFFFVIARPIMGQNVD